MASATTTYSGSYTSSVTDSLGNTVTYNYNQNNGILNSVADPVGTVTTYTHNQYNDNLTKVIFNTKTATDCNFCGGFIYI